MAINMVISTLFLPTIMKLTNDSFIGSEIQIGLVYFTAFISFGIISDLHSTFFIEPLKRRFRSSLICDIEDHFNRLINGFKWNQFRELKKKNIEERKNIAQWSIRMISEMMISNLIHLFPFFGYSIWILYISPISLIAYIIGIIAVIKFYPKQTKIDHDNNTELWDRYHSINYNMFNRTIHGKSEDSLSEMKECRMNIERRREIERSSDDKLSVTLRSVFDIIFALNCLLFIPNFSPGNIMTYLQYTYIVKQELYLFTNFFNTYEDSKRDYKKFQEMISDCEIKEMVPQTTEFSRLHITELKFKYSTGFELHLDSHLCFQPGQLVKLSGRSGSGKSSFVDLLSGIYDNNDYTATIYIDGSPEPNGFNALNGIRCYTEQAEGISDRPCIYEIISGRQFNSDSDDIDDVWRSLEMTHSTEFVKRYDDSNDKKSWIGLPNPGLSGGQRSRIKLAKSIYRLLTMRPKIVILDEVDTNIQPDMLVDIMSIIFRFCKENNILTFIVGHTTEVNNMQYDQTILFNDGCITGNK
jgi:ABC-type multidrug transport system fused ATPase/permease subunit